MIGAGCPRSCACICGSLAALSFILVLVAIAEKQRWTPFYRPMKCVPNEPVYLPLSDLRPSPFLAGMMGLTASPPPHGIYLNTTTAMTCENPNQVVITMKAEGSKLELWAPDLADLANGGTGEPFTTTGSGVLTSDVHLDAGGGTGDIEYFSQIGYPEGAMLASMAVSAVQGYSTSYTKSITPMTTCMTLFGSEMCKETTVERWCGSFRGSCLVKVKGDDGQPLDPVQFEPAVCVMSRSICSETLEDMQAGLTLEAAGCKEMGTAPCSPTSGMPAGSMCNVVEGPGINPTTKEAQIIDPPTQNTPLAQQKLDEKMEAGETFITAVTVGVAVVFAPVGIFSLVLSVIYCRLVMSAQIATEKEALPALPAILNTKPAVASKETNAGISV